MKRQRMRRLLALFLSLVMALTLVPGAYAQSEEESTGLTWKQVDNSAVSASIGREEVKELEETPLYDEDEQVRVSIVLEGEPTLALYSLASEDGEEANAMAYREELQAYQEAAAEYISEEALDNDPLDVVWNLTLAANIISANVEFGRIEAIKAVEGVEDVIVEQRYDILGFRVPDDPNLVVSTGMTHTVDVWNNGRGYTGAGMRIAIIDTGLDIAHRSFDNDAFLYALEKDAEADGVDVSSYDLLDAAEIAGKLDRLNAKAGMPGVTAEQLYHNEKLPYCFNYVDDGLDVTHENDTQGEHGSHVAGISAANRYVKKGDRLIDAMDEVKMVGNAPDAQVLVMKVFGQGGGAYDSDYFAAIEDAVILGCDTVNLSLGSGSAGMTTAGEYQEIMDNLTNTDTVVTISAGNNSFWAEQTTYGLPYADDVNFHTGGSPGTYTNSLGVASVDNNGMVSNGAILVGGWKLGYTESTDYGNAPIGTLDPGGAGTAYDYIFIDGIGRPEDFAGIPVAGKIAFCSRGVTSFYEKANAAVAAGAIATVIYNNQPGTIGLNLTGYTGSAPVVSIFQSDAAAIKAASTRMTTESGKEYFTGSLEIKGSTTVTDGTTSYETMSSFSSWGAPGDLSMKPEITAPGGNIWSLNGAHKGDGGHESHEAYETMSGTSMAAPQMAGIGALVKQYIEKEGLSAKVGVTDRALAQSLMMSTATPLTDASGNYYSILQQGAGMVNTQAAVNADSYILMNSSANDSYADGKVKVELGDDPAKNGTYTVNFTINNLDGKDHGYALSADVFTQAIDEGLLSTATTPLAADVTWTWNGTGTDGGKLYDFNGDGFVNLEDGNALLDVATGRRTRDSLSHKELLADFETGGRISSYTGYEFLQKAAAASTQLTVPANGSVNVTATITLNGAAKTAMLAKCPNGFYVEAYIKATSIATEEGALGTSHSIPVLGFCGNWTDASMFDKNSYTDVLYGDWEWPYLFLAKGGNPDKPTVGSLISNYLIDGDGYAFGGNPLLTDDEYLPARNAMNSTNGSKLAKWAFTAIRNAAASRLLVKNADTGAEYLNKELGEVAAAYYHANSGRWQNTGYNLNLNWAGTDKEGHALAEGTTVELSLTLAPELYVNADGSVNWNALGEGASQKMQLTIDNTAPHFREGSDLSYNAANKKLTVTAQDNEYIAAVAVFSEDGTRAIAAETPNQKVKNAVVTMDLDLSEALGKKFLVQVYDYAQNAVTYELEQTIKSELDGYYFGYDSAESQWVAYTKGGSNSAVVGYGDKNAPIYAAAYAGGYVFAIDEHCDFYAIDASDPMVLDSRTMITTLDDLYAEIYGFTICGAVLSMSYSAVNQKMYLAYYAADAEDYFTDNALGTIDLQTGEITKIADMPELWAVAVAGDGTIYGLTMGEDDEAYKLVKILIGQQNAVTTQVIGTLTDLDATWPAMTWDSTENKLVVSDDDAIYTVDPTTGAAVAVPGTKSLTGLFVKPAAGGDRLPAATAATHVTLSDESLALVKGETARLSAKVEPWNLTNKGVTWSSSNTAVAIVSDGVVTPVGAGTATITATSNATSTVKATCEVKVLAIEEPLQALIWDTEGVEWWSTFNTGDLPNYTKRMKSDVRYLATATMGADGFIYAATLNTGSDNPSDLYRVNPQTMVAERLATMGGGFPVADLADRPLVPNGLVVVSQYFLLVPGKADGAARGFNLGSSIRNAYILGIAYLGQDVQEDEDTGENVDVDVYAFITDDGTLYLAALSADNSLWLDRIGNTGYEAEAEYFNSLAYVYDENHVPYLFWSRWNGEADNVSELIAIDIDNGNGVHSLGNFGEGVWPVGGLMSEEIPGLPASVSALLHSGEMQKVDRMDVFGGVPSQGEQPPVDEPPVVEPPVVEPPVVEPPVDEPPVAGEPPMVMETLSASITSESGIASVSGSGRIVVRVQLDEASTNGLIEAVYNPGDLQLVSVDGKATLNSANVPVDGKVILAYAYKNEAPAGTIVAELVFASRNQADTAVTLTQTEDGTQTGLHNETTVTIWMPDEPYYPGGGGISGGGSGSGGSTQPDKPTKPDEPTEPTEPTEPAKPAPGATVNVPSAPAAEKVPEIVAPYTDLQEGRWYTEYAAYMIDSGLMSGTSAGSFSPDEPLTRGMLVTILHRAAGLPAAGPVMFSDVAASSWYANGIAWASGLGVVNGYKDGTFGPKDSITRQELAVILWRFAQALGISVATDGTTMPDFADRSEIASWAGEAMSWAYRTGILTGRDGNRLAPRDGATRIEAAAMLTRFLKLVENSQSPRQ